MNILAFDTAAAACSAIFLRDDVPVAHEWQAMARGHAEALMPMIERVMNGASYDALAAIGVSIGPGAFTGLRIALATARGLSLATGVPAVGVTSFEVAAGQAARAWQDNADLLVVALETKRADFYLQAFAASGAPLTEPASVPAEGVARWLPPGARRLAIAGDAATRLSAALPAGIVTDQIAGTALPDAAVVAELVAARLAVTPSLATAEWPPLQPFYLRPPDAKLPGQRLRAGTEPQSPGPS